MAEADDDFDFLAKNQTLVLTYDITVSDNHGGTAVQTVQVTVTGTDGSLFPTTPKAARLSTMVGADPRCPAPIRARARG